MSNKKKGLGEFEFIALMAFLMSNVALAIDTVLPALPNIGTSLQVTDSNSLQLIIIMIFQGLGVGELLFGTLSDSFGRKPIVYIGVAVFIAASFIIVWAPNLEVLLAGRILQGIGLSAARSVSVAIIRDSYKGDRMARVMSFIMTIFILVPMVAPMLGQMILRAFNWEAIFYFQVFFISVTIIWFRIRQVETLTKEKRIPFSKQLFTNGLKVYFQHKSTVLYTIVTGLVQGGFIAYLSTAQRIFQEQYQMQDEFPYIFGALAFTMGISALLNASFVMKFGMLKLVKKSLIIFNISALLFIVFFFNGPNPSLAIVMFFMALQFLSLGFTFGNLSALAMQPIGHIAGIGAAIFSFSSMIISVAIAFTVGVFIEDTILPLFIGFLLTGLLSFILIHFISAKKGNS